MKKILSLLLLTTLVVIASYAQKFTVENVRKASLRSSGVIKQRNDVKGYYLLYATDKIDRKTNLYKLNIFDDKLVLIKEVEFEEGTGLLLLESAFNGSDLAFLFYNQQKSSFVYHIYGADGNKKFEHVREISQREKNYFSINFFTNQESEHGFSGLTAIDNVGFICNLPSRKEKDYTFELTFINSNTQKVWTYTPNKDYKKFLGDYLGYANGVLYTHVLKFTSFLFDQNPDAFLLALNAETGEPVFEIPSNLPENAFYPTSLIQDENNKPVIIGEYFEHGGNILKATPQGIGFAYIQPQGKIEIKKLLGWQANLSKYFDISQSGKIDDFGYMFFHDIVKLKDGNTYIVAEGIKKTISALGVASAILNRSNTGTSLSKLKITDMIVLKLNDKLEVKGGQIIEKDHHGIEMPSGAEFVSVAALGKLVKFGFGGFDYRYTQIKPDTSGFNVCYTDYEKTSDYKGRTFNSLSIKNGKAYKDRVTLKSEATSSSVYPANNGKILVADYYKKEKKIEMHFEKFN